MPADVAARERMLDPTRSFAVRAPAGSGKTDRLTARYLTLLARVSAPEAVLAITFTRKAAAEMRDRVLNQLAAPESGTPAERARARDRELGWRLLDNPSRLAIDTFDALARRIVSQMPWIARFGAVPDVAEDAGALYMEAARRTMELAAEASPAGDAVARLLLHDDNRGDRWMELVTGMLARRDQWLHWLVAAELDLGAARREFEAALAAIREPVLRRARETFGAELFDEALALSRVAAQSLGAAPAEDAWQAIAATLLTKDGALRKTVTKRDGLAAGTPGNRRARALLDRLAASPAGLALVEVAKLPPGAYPDAQWSVLAAALSTLKRAAAELYIVFRERGEVDFTEIGLAASHALGDADHPTDLALALGCRFEHILVDEFQDTSRLQFRLLEKLTAGWSQGDGRTLFLVGDPMQSIYRFRHAEVGLFQHAEAEGLGEVKLDPVPLSVNFRSAHELVAWVNENFQTILPAQDDAATGAVSFHQAHAESEETNGAVRFHAILDDAGAARQTARVMEILRAAPPDACIGVLARKKSGLDPVARALRRAGIAFQAVDLDPLGERPVVEDLMALTFALLHPMDRISWLAVLRAPYCGVALGDLHAIATANECVWDALDGAMLTLSTDGRARLDRIRPVLERALARVGHTPLRALVEDAWRALGGPHCLARETDLQDADAFLALLDETGEGGAAWDFRALRERVARLNAAPGPASGDRLRLMTIHKAKGLEFDIVIVAGLEAVARRASGDLVQWLETEYGLVAAPVKPAGADPDPLYKWIAQRRKEQDDNETKRLLYVAVTRAKRELHLLGSVKTGANGVIKPPKDTLLGTFWHVVAREFEHLEAPAAPAEVFAQAPAGLVRVSAAWTPPPAEEAPRWERRGAAAAEDDEAREPTFEWVSETARHCGEVVHAFLERIAREGLERWDGAAVRRSRRAFANALANLGVAAGELDGAAARVERALAATLADERGRWILSPHREARGELALASAAGAVRIDRTFIDERGTRWIVDFKVSDHAGGALDEFLDNERERHRPQLERYARLLASGDARPIKLGLYFPLPGGWREWDAPRTLGAPGAG